MDGFPKKIVLGLLIKSVENCEVWLKQDENNALCVTDCLHSFLFGFYNVDSVLSVKYKLRPKKDLMI